MSFLTRQLTPFRICTAAAILVALIQVWLPAYYITGDGATHLYNAAMLKDHWLGNHTAFYSQFFTLFAIPNPNWFGHILLAALLFVFSGAIAEKVLITIYLLLAISAFYKLVAMRGSNRYVSFLIFPLLFNLLLSKGFYNFALSTGLFLWIIWAWLNYLRSPALKNILLLAAIAVLTYFAHPVGFLYGFIACVCLFLSNGFLFAVQQEIPVDLRKVSRNFIALLFAFVPCLLLLKLYMSNYNSGEFDLLLGRLEGIIYFKVFITHRLAEMTPVKIAGFSLLFMLLLAPLISMAMYKRVQGYTGLFLFVFICLFMYCYLPDTMMGGSMFTLRAQYMLYLSLALYIAMVKMPVTVDRFLGLLVWGTFIATAFIRLPALYKAGQAVENLLSSRKVIKPGSVVLVLNFSFPGEDEKRENISDCNWLFTHPFDYMGTEKPLILLDNYEANTDYFPFRWASKANPYHYMGKEEGLEGQPPYADIKAYKDSCNITPDYIVFWCYKDEYRSKGHVQQMLDAINKDYQQVYATPDGRTMVYFYNK